FRTLETFQCFELLWSNYYSVYVIITVMCDSLKWLLKPIPCICGNANCAHLFRIGTSTKQAIKQCTYTLCTANKLLTVLSGLACCQVTNGYGDVQICGAAYMLYCHLFV